VRAPAARAHADRPRLGELLWLEPYPDALLEGLADWRASFSPRPRSAPAGPADCYRPGPTASPRSAPTPVTPIPAAFYTVGLVVLTLSDTRTSSMTRFGPTTLPRFGLPASLPD